jgi:hypothetical protein
MRKSLTFTALLLFAAIVAPNALRAQTIYDWTDTGTSATGNAVNANGTITTNIVGGLDVVVAGSGVFNGDSLSLIEGNGTGSIQTSLPFVYDNVLYPTSTTLLDIYGLLFQDNANGAELNIYWNGTGPGPSDYVASELLAPSINVLNTGTEFSITPALSPTPEPATWSLMLIGALLLGSLVVMRKRIAVGL